MATKYPTTIDKVRLKIGDTDVGDPLLTDAEINVCLSAWPNNLDLAAANAAEAIAAGFARQIDFVTDGQSFRLSQRANQYLTLAETLRRRGSTFAAPLGGTVYGGTA